MSAEIVPIVRSMNLALKLRELADEIDAGIKTYDRITLIGGGDIYCWGPVADSHKAEGAIFDMTWGIHYMMGLPVKVQLEMDGD